MALTILTWNLAMLERSAEAPHTWGMEHTEQAVRERVVSHAPDVVFFQELPRAVPYLETHDMLRANPETHQGNLAILIRHELLANERRISEPVVTVIEGCAVMVTLSSGLTLANVHLAPGPAAVGERLEQLARIVESSPTPRLLIAGDTNSRVDEEEPLAEAGLTGERPPRPTWDGKRNRFHTDIPEFSAYFTRWFATSDLTVSDVALVDDPVEMDTHRFYLSDHHGLFFSVAIT